MGQMFYQRTCRSQNPSIQTDLLLVTGGSWSLPVRAGRRRRCKNNVPKAEQRNQRIKEDKHHKICNISRRNAAGRKTRGARREHTSTKALQFLLVI